MFIKKNRPYDSNRISRTMKLGNYIPRIPLLSHLSTPLFVDIWHYQFTLQFCRLINKGPKFFRNLLIELKADDQNSPSLIPWLCSIFDKQKTYAALQKDEHDSMINDFFRKLEGSVALASDLRKTIADAKRVTDSEYETLMKMKENKISQWLCRSDAEKAKCFKEGVGNE